MLAETLAPTNIQRFLNVGVPHVADEAGFLDLVKGLLHSRRLTNNGPLVCRLECALAEFLGVGHCVCVSNCAVGIQIAARALDLTGEVITTPFTFSATIQSLAWCGLRPVLVDILREDDTIDPSDVERAITPETSGILAVHIWGRPCRVNDLQRIAREHSLQLFYDAAHAFGSRTSNRLIGGFGIFSEGMVSRQDAKARRGTMTQRVFIWFPNVKLTDRELARGSRGASGSTCPCSRHFASGLPPA